MINGTFIFLTPPPWSEKLLFQWLYMIIINIFTKRLLASWGERSQIFEFLKLFLVLISYCGWWFLQVTVRSCICFGHSSHFWPDRPIHSTLYNNFNRLCPHVLNWRGYTIELHRHDSEFPVYWKFHTVIMKGCLCSVWIFLLNKWLEMITTLHSNTKRSP